MNEGDVFGVECPCCKEVLYRQVFAEDKGVGIWGSTSSSPKLAKDGEGWFMKCPHCSNRIAFEEVVAQPSGRGWQLSQNQKCDRKLP